MRIDFRRWFDRVIALVYSVILLFLTLSIIIGVVRLFLTFGNLLVHEELTRDFQQITASILTLFILIELSRSLIEYFDTRQFRITFIVDATIVFILREVMIGLFEHTLAATDIYALSALLLVISVLRIGSVVLFQRERKMLENVNTADTPGP